ncbi:MAG: CBS domain-containing protein [Alphaproteobacteria bacterium]|nr:CBS domain-containing protein [Alphaproteobacteria bacterium]
MMTNERPKKYAETVHDVVENRACPKFSSKDTVSDIIRRMHQHGGGAGAVVNAENKLIGLVTEREIVRRAFGDTSKLQERLDYISHLKDSKDETAWDVMIAQPETLNHDDSIDDAVDVIDYLGYRFMPVVDNQNRLIGVVDARELHKHAKLKSKALLEKKDSLLSYMMGSEPYGVGASL